MLLKVQFIMTDISLRRPRIFLLALCLQAPSIRVLTVPARLAQVSSLVMSALTFLGTQRCAS